MLGMKLKTLNKPYHAVPWLFEDNLERSQVVCPIDGLIDFNWVYAHEEGFFTSTDVQDEIEFVNEGGSNELLKQFKRRIKSSYRTSKNAEGEITYFQKIGNIWIGSNTGK